MSCNIMGSLAAIVCRGWSQTKALAWHRFESRFEP